MNFSNTMLSNYSVKSENETKEVPSSDTGRLGVMNSLAQTIQRILLTPAEEKKSGPGTHDLAQLLTEDQALWQNFQSKIKSNNITTNVGIEQYLYLYINENKEFLLSVFEAKEKSKQEALNTIRQPRRNSVSSCVSLIQAGKDLMASTSSESFLPSRRRFSMGRSSFISSGYEEKPSIETQVNLSSSTFASRNDEFNEDSSSPKIITHYQTNNNIYEIEHSVEQRRAQRRHSCGVNLRYTWDVAMNNLEREKCS